MSDHLLWEGDPQQVIGSSTTFKQLARLAGAPRSALRVEEARKARSTKKRTPKKKPRPRKKAA